MNSVYKRLDDCNCLKCHEGNFAKNSLIELFIEIFCAVLFYAICIVALVVMDNPS